MQSSLLIAFNPPDRTILARTLDYLGGRFCFLDKALAELIDSPDRAHAESRHQGARRAQSALLPLIIRFELLVAAREASEFRHRWRNQRWREHRI
jgi:hypothetical protein